MCLFYQVLYFPNQMSLDKVKAGVIATALS